MDRGALGCARTAREFPESVLCPLVLSGFVFWRVRQGRLAASLRERTTSVLDVRAYGQDGTGEGRGDVE